MGNGGEEKGREDALARNCAVGGGEGLLSATALTVDELETTTIAASTAKRGGPKHTGGFVGIRKWNGYSTHRSRSRGRELDDAQNRSINA